jgi:hypothetical protein
MNKNNKYIPTLILLLIVSICTLLVLQYIQRPQREHFNDSTDVCVVTAYYPLHKNKHGHQKYKNWIKYFFEGVTCDIICFCPAEIHDELLELAGQNSRVKFVVREFDSFDMMSASQMDVWRTFHLSDPEKDVHSPELYAVWAAKQEFVREAIKMNSADIYVWCDIGCFRESRMCDFKHTYKYVQPGKITGLSISNMIGGGVLAGDKDAWELFARLYLDELKSNPHGKDQIIFKRVLNDTNAVIITPSKDETRDPWFYLTYIFNST